MPLRGQPPYSRHLGSRLKQFGSKRRTRSTTRHLDLVQGSLQKGATGAVNPPGFIAPVGDWDLHSRASRTRGKQAFHYDIDGRLTEAVGQDRDAGRSPPRQHPLSWLRTRRLRTFTARAGEWKFGRALLRKVDALAAQAAKSPHRHLLALLVPTVPLCAFWEKNTRPVLRPTGCQTLSATFLICLRAGMRRDTRLGNPGVGRQDPLRGVAP